jgi:F-type H+-transporting ATPase subunit c
MKLRNALVLVGSALMIAPSAFAETATQAASTSSLLGPLAAAIAIGLPAGLAALSQGRTVSAALDGMARNPQAKLQTPMIIGLALIESLVIFSFLIASQLLNK